MRVLVTGADGFIGSHLVRELEAQGDEVIAWSRPGNAPDIERVADVTREVETARPDAIYHLAGQADVAQSWADPAKSMAINAGGTANIFHALRELDSDARVLLMSSAEVYGNVDPRLLPVPETTAFDPASPYGVSKVAAEYAAMQSWRSMGQEVVICRPFNHLGPGQSPSFVASAIARRIVENERSAGSVVRVGDLSSTRDFVDVRDGVRAYRLVMELGEPGQAYNVSSGIETRVATLVEMLISQSTVAQHTETDPSLLRPARLARIAGATAKLSKCTGWTPSIDIGEMAAAVVDDWRERLNEQEQE